MTKEKAQEILNYHLEWVKSGKTGEYKYTEDTFNEALLAVTSEPKVGDQVRIVANSNLHGFEIGEVVTLDHFSVNAWKAYNKNFWWFIGQKDFEAL